jgi:hypothetical protein
MGMREISWSFYTHDLDVNALWNDNRKGRDIEACATEGDE